MLSHFQPEQIATAIILADETIESFLQLNKRTVALINGAAGPFALIAHEAYFIERLRDVKTIILRLKSNRELITQLLAKETALRPKKRIYQKRLSEPLQKIVQQSQDVHQQMKLDMESLYIFGNLMLDQWAHIVGYVIGDPVPDKFSFAMFVTQVQKKGDKELLETLWQKHRQEILWLFYQLRMYRNVFIEHMRVPRQRGTSRTVDGHDFKLFSPTSIGGLSDDQIEYKLRSIVHPAPNYIKRFPSTTWHKGNISNLLEEIFYNIDQIAEQADREKVWNIWNDIGGSTPSYDVTAMRLTHFAAKSMLTIIEMMSMHPDKVNLGKVGG